MSGKQTSIPPPLPDPRVSDTTRSTLARIPEPNSSQEVSFEEPVKPPVQELSVDRYELATTQPQKYQPASLLDEDAAAAYDQAPPQPQEEQAQKRAWRSRIHFPRRGNSPQPDQEVAGQSSDDQSPGNLKQSQPSSGGGKKRLFGRFGRSRSKSPSNSQQVVQPAPAPAQPTEEPRQEVQRTQQSVPRQVVVQEAPQEPPSRREEVHRPDSRQMASPIRTVVYASDDLNVTQPMRGGYVQERSLTPVRPRPAEDQVMVDSMGREVVYRTTTPGMSYEGDYHAPEMPIPPTQPSRQLVTRASQPRMWVSEQQPPQYAPAPRSRSQPPVVYQDDLEYQYQTPQKAIVERQVVAEPRLIRDPGMIPGEAPLRQSYVSPTLDRSYTSESRLVTAPAPALAMDMDDPRAVQQARPSKRYVRKTADRIVRDDASRDKGRSCCRKVYQKMGQCPQFFLKFLILTSVIVGWILGGGLLLRELESDAWVERVAFLKAANTLLPTSLLPVTALNTKGVTCQDVVDPVSNPWDLENAMFFCLNTITTIGMTSQTPQTWGGKLVTIFYAILGIGIMILCYAQAGVLLVQCIHLIHRMVHPGGFQVNGRGKLKKKGMRSVARVFTQSDKDGSGTLDLFELQNMLSRLGGTWVDEDALDDIMEAADVDGSGTIDEEEFSIAAAVYFAKRESERAVVPACVSIIIFILMIFIGGWFWEGREPAWTYWESCWFVFTTLTTIGYGDFRPSLTNQWNVRWAAIWIFVGLSFMSMLLVSMIRLLAPKINKLRRAFHRTTADAADWAALGRRQKAESRIERIKEEETLDAIIRAREKREAVARSRAGLDRHGMMV